MRFIEVSFKNLKRKKIRSFLTIGGIAIAVAVLVSLLGFDEGYQQGLRNDINKMGYQLLVTAKGCPYEAATLMLKGGGGLRYMEQDVYEKIYQDERVEKITPQLAHTIYDPDKNNGEGGLSLFMGIHDSYLNLKPWIKFRDGEWFSSPAANEVIMGYEAAQLEQRLSGDKVFIPGIEKILTVRGIFERTGTQDDGIIFLPIKTAQNIFDLPNKLTGLGIKLTKIEQITEFEEALYNEPGIQVISMAQVQGTIFNLISSAKVMANAIALIAIFVAVIGVINTILMSVFDRTKEIGVMKALGASRMDIFYIILLETMLICFLGGVFGSIFAVLGSNLTETVLRHILPYAPSSKLVLITLKLLFASLLGAIILGMIAGIYPAYRASSMKPIEAIRQGE